MASLEDLLERYTGQVRRQKELRETSPSALPDLTNQAVKLRSSNILETTSSLSNDDTEDMEAIFGTVLDKAGSRQIGQLDPSQGEQDQLVSIMRLGGVPGIRGMVSLSVVEGYKTGLALAKRCAALSKLLQADITELQTTFGKFDRTAFATAVKLDASSSVTVKAISLETQWAALVAEAAALGSFGPVNVQLQQVCAEALGLFDVILAPNTFTSKLYALISRIASRITQIIDLMLEVLDLIDALLAIRARLTEKSGTFAMQFRIHTGGLSTLSTFVGDLPTLVTRPEFLRGDVLRNLALELKAVVEAVCADPPDLQAAVQVSVPGFLLKALEGALGPIRPTVVQSITDLKDGAQRWLLAFRQHVQVDTGSAFGDIVTEALGKIDTVINTMAILEVATGKASPALTGQVEGAPEVFDRLGMDGFSKSVRDGDVAAAEETSVAVGTLGGQISDGLAKERADRVAAKTLTNTEAVLFDDLNLFFANQQRAKIQSAALQGSLVSDAFHTLDDLDRSLDAAERAKGLLV